MGCCASKGTADERATNKKIGKKMKQDANNNTHRILLLGPGDAGKTTILKQLRQIYNGKIPEDTIESYKGYIRQKVIYYMKILCDQSIKLNIDISSDSLESREFIHNLSTPCNLDMEIVDHMKILWNDNGIQQTMEEREKYQLPCNVDYFFNQRIDDIINDDYLPTFDDYIRVRMRTTGFSEEKFTTNFDHNGVSSPNYTLNDNNDSSNIAPPSSTNNGSQKMSAVRQQSQSQIMSMSTTATATIPPIPSTQSNENSAHDGSRGISSSMGGNGQEHSFIFTDVGGQRSERKKWMGMMKDDIDAVVYIIAISEYDLMCFEDSKMLRLQEALNLFQKVIKAGFMTDKTVTLFFNKYDLLLKKLNDDNKSTIKDHFADFPGDSDPRDADDVCSFVYDKFLEIYQRELPNASGAPHYHRTSALDTDQIDNLMGDIQSDLIRNQLKLAGF